MTLNGHGMSVVLLAIALPRLGLCANARAGMSHIPLDSQSVTVFTNCYSARSEVFDTLSRPLVRAGTFDLYMPYRAKIFQGLIVAENQSKTASSKVRGQVGESLMDDFFTGSGGGWEKLEGQYGTKGIDGLYVKRTAGGTIYEFQIVDSKVATSGLGWTADGWQLGKEWTESKLRILIKNAEQEYARNPTRQKLKEINDYKQLQTLIVEKNHYPTPRVYHTELETKNGQTILVQKNGTVEFPPTGKPVIYYNPNQKPMYIDMKTPASQLGKRKLKARERFYSRTQDELISKGMSPKRAAAAVRRIRDDIESGKITNSKQYHHKICSELSAETRMRLRIARGGGILFGGLMEAGFVFARDGVSNGINGETFDEAGVSFVKGAGAYAAIDAGIAYGAKKTTQYVAKKIATGIVKRRFAEKATRGTLQNMTEVAIKKQMEKETKKVSARLAKTLAPKIAGAAASGVQCLFSAYEIASSCVEYNAGRITQRDATVYSSLGGLAIVGAAAGCFLTCTETGAALGSWAGPVGTAIGVGVGVLAGVGGFAYGVFTGFQEAHFREAEIAARLEWESNDNCAKLERKISACRDGARKSVEDGWSMALNHK